MMPPPPLNLDEIGKDPAGSSQTEVEIQISQTDNYTSGTTVKASTMANNPKSGFKRYTHYIGENKFTLKRIKKDASTNLTGALDNNITTANTRFVHVYHGGPNTNTPLLIAIKGTSWEYYSNDNPNNANNRNWTSVTITVDPDGTSNGPFLVELDKLNDKANGQTVIHLEKTDTVGVIESSGNKNYYTGPSSGTITITVAQASNNVPDGYVAYEHKCTGNLTNVTFKHNGNPIKWKGSDSEYITIEKSKKVWVFYRDGDLDKPLLLYFKKGTSSSATDNWYGKGMKWIFQDKLKGVDASTSLPGGNDKNKIASKLNEMVRQGTFKELSYESYSCS